MQALNILAVSSRQRKWLKWNCSYCTDTASLCCCGHTSYNIQTCKRPVTLSNFSTLSAWLIPLQLIQIHSPGVTADL